jgi:hypothetical protein
MSWGEPEHSFERRKLESVMFKADEAVELLVKFGAEILDHL